MPDRPSRLKIVAAFLAIYTIWGSTYLAIRIAIETIPPFLMAGTRFVVAGALLFAWARVREPRRHGERATLTAANWKAALVVGGFLLLGGNGAVTWAEQTVPSGVAALLVATVPLWIVLIEWLGYRGRRPGAQVVAGIIVGLAGLALLVGPGELVGGGTIDPVGAGVLVVGSISWAWGSLYSRAAPLPRAPLVATGMEMLAGGALLLLLGVLTGELGLLEPDRISARSLLALAYLIVFGAIIGYSAYVWLIKVQPAARVATYAYVNPVVAVLLGWALADEPLTARVLLAAAIILAGVIVITTARAARRQPGMQRPETAGTPADEAG